MATPAADALPRVGRPRAAPAARAWAIRPAATIGLVVALTLFFAAGAIGLLEHRLTIDAGAWAFHTLDVVTQTDRVLGDLVDAETGQRGYLLTGDEQHLEPYRRARAALPGDVQALRRLTTDNAGQQERLGRIQTMVAAKLDELARTIDARRRNGAEAALRAEGADAGKQTMDRLRAELHEAQAMEQRLLQERMAMRAARSARTQRFVAATTALGGFLAIASIVGLNVETRRRLRAERSAIERGERLRVTLASIGDGVVATDAQGRVQFMNAVAEELTGWPQSEARGRPLDEVFRIVNEHTRGTVENPVARVLREGTVVGLANHTLLLAKDGREIPIADSGAPVRDGGGELMGVVLVFRDASVGRAQAEERERRIRAEVAATESARVLARFDALATAGVVGVVFGDTDGLSDANQAFCALVGVSLDDVRARRVHWVDITAPEYHARDREAFARLVDDGFLPAYEKVFVRGDGARVPVLVAAVVTQADPPQWLSLVIDRSALVRAEAALSESEARYRRLVEALPSLVWTCTPDGRCDYLSPQWLLYTGRPAAEHLGDGWVDVVHPDDRPATLARWTEAVRAAVPCDFDYRLRGADGTYRTFRAMALPLHDHAGALTQWIGISFDVHATRAAEAALAESNARLELALGVGDLGSWDWDLLRDTVVWSEGHFRVLGYAPDAITPSYAAWEARLHPDDRAAVLARIDAARRTRGDFRNEYRIVRPSREIRWVEARGRFFCDPGGEPFRMVGVLADVTERRSAEAEREDLLRIAERARAEADEANRAKDDFLAVLSHELRSPLTAMLGWITLLQRGVLSADKTRHAIATLERNVKLQAELVNDLLDVSRIVSGKLALEETLVDVTVVVEAAVDAVRPAAAAKGVELRTTVAPCAGNVFGDAKRLQQVVTNLLTNAVKFTSAGGTVTVRLAQEASEARIEVRDTGVGIAPEFLPHVFDRFRQADSSITRAHGGLGLGLAIVKNLVELHHGRVEATSPGIGAGAGFTVRLPLGDATRPTRARGGACHDGDTVLHGVAVLVVDDDTDTREALAITLATSGATVRHVASAVEARRELETFHPDVIVSDVGMPKEDGYDFVRALRAGGGRYVPAVAMTGFASKEDRDAAQRAGFDEHVAKPVNPADLVGTLRRMVGREPDRA